MLHARDLFLRFVFFILTPILLGSCVSKPQIPAPVVVKPVIKDGIITTIAGNGIKGFSGDNGPAISAETGDPSGVAVDANGNVFISENYNNRIRKITPSGIITTIAGYGIEGFDGDGGSATNAKIASPYGVAVDDSGNVYFADNFNQRVRKVTTAGIINTIAGNGTQGYSGDGGSALSAELNYPAGVAVDRSGSVYIADTYNNRIRKVTPSGTISTIAGSGSPLYNGDGGAATAAGLYSPTGVAVDGNGNVYIADNYNNRIRKVTPSGIISTVAGTGIGGFSNDDSTATKAEIGVPYGIAADAKGNIYIADNTNNRIRKVNSTGIINTIAGTDMGYSGDAGAATIAQLAGPYSVAVDDSGNVYIADHDNQRIRKVSR